MIWHKKARKAAENMTLPPLAPKKGNKAFRAAEAPLPVVWSAKRRAVRETVPSAILTKVLEELLIGGTSPSAVSGQWPVVSSQ
jgi:hypothetical protein